MVHCITWGNQPCKFCTHLSTFHCKHTLAQNFDMFAGIDVHLTTRRVEYTMDIKAIDIIEKVDSFNWKKFAVKASSDPEPVPCPCDCATPQVLPQVKKERIGRKLADRNGTRNAALRWSRKLLHWISRTKKRHDSQKRATKPKRETILSVGRSLALSRSTSHEPEVTVYVFSMVYNSFDSCLSCVLYTTS